MPLYEYECLECGHLTEVLQRMGDPPLAECPRCGSAVRKVLSAPAFQFKGSGWYVTDYADKKKSDGEKGEKGEKEPDSAVDSKPAAEKKTDAKPASGSPSD